MVASAGGTEPEAISGRAGPTCPSTAMGAGGCCCSPWLGSACGARPSLGHCCWMFLLGTSLFSWSGCHRMLHVPPSPCSHLQARARMELLQGRAELLALPPEVSHGQLGVLAGVCAITAPFTCPVSGAGHGFVLWNTFLIKPGNEQGAQVVHAGTGLHHHQLLPGLTLANPSCPVTLIPVPLGHPVSPWLQSGLWHPGLALHGLSSSHLAAPCPAGSPNLPPPGAAAPGVALSGTNQAVTHW